METGFPQEVTNSSNMSQTLEALACLQQTVTPSMGQVNSDDQSLLNIQDGNESAKPAITSQGHTGGQTQTHAPMTYHQNSSNITEIHMPEGEILTPHYVIVEDPIALHSYADFGAASIIPSFSLPEDRNSSVLIVSGNDVYTSNYSINSTAGNQSSTISANTKLKTKVSDSKNFRKETILAVPVIGAQKTSSAVEYVGNENLETDSQSPVVISEMQEHLKEQLDKTVAESVELGNLNSDLTKESVNIPKNVENIEMDISDSTMLVKESVQVDNTSQEYSVAVATSAEASTNTEEDLLSDFDASDNEIEEDKENSLEKITHEKTMFSENLGLIPAENELKIIAERAKNASKGVRTRKSYEQGTLNATVEPVRFTGSVTSSIKGNNKPIRMELGELSINQGHKHHPGCYRCGACSRSFMTICKLHDHLQDHCFGGSYHYDHLLKTAFPKYDTTCSYAQTNFDFDKENTQNFMKPTKNSKVMIKLKAPKVQRKKSAQKKCLLPALGKRKRGRPKKIKSEHIDIDIDESPQMDLEEPNEAMEVEAKDEAVSYNIDGTEFDTLSEPPANVEAKSVEIVEHSESDIKSTAELSDMYLVDREDNVDKETKSESEIEKKKTRKRKSSVPRKIMVATDSDTSNEKIANSRSKPEMKIHCEFCPSKFQHTRGLIRHEQEKHVDQMKFECDECGQKFMRDYNLERHRLCSHTVSKSKFMQQRKGIYREKKKLGRKLQEKSPEPTAACQICGMEVPETKLDSHIRLHTGERPYICHVCGKGLISDKKLKRHLLIHSEEQRHTCDVCGQGFSMKYKLRTHMFIHTGHKPYLCSVCGAEFNNSTSLLHHNRTVHLGDKRFECTVCGGKYGKKSQLEEHMFSHSEERTQTCRFCGKSFKHAKSLRRHEQTHVSDQKFQCDQCDSKFSRKDNLERHKMCHYEATLQCSFCKKKFRDRQPLLEHEQFHINQKRQTCQICKERFQDETYFYNHMEKNHGVTRDMVPMIAALTNSPTKEVKSRLSGDVPMDNLIMDSVKGSTLDDTGQIDLPAQQRSSIDTLNLSMSVAGILPTTSSGQELGNGAQTNLQAGSMSQSNILNQIFNVNQNAPNMNMNTTRILNQPGNAGIISTGGMFTGMNEMQRMALNVMNAGENTHLRLPLDQPGANVTLTTDNALTPEQQRIIQEAVGTALPNLQGQGYRLQNIFNQ